MYFKFYFFITVSCLDILCLVFGQSILKSSLTFVIDDTSSMSDDITAVKSGVNAIFNAVMDSTASQIENFILVTFNDPVSDSKYVKLRTITRDREEFRRALELIEVHGGGDCPEYPLSGIELALQESLPASYIYVFTDASSKDSTKIELVKNLAISKECQVVFVLTGTCGSSELDPDFKVFRQLADATSGQIFNLMKNDVKDILDYVVETIKGRMTELASGKFAPGYNNSLPFTLDIRSSDLLISVTGTDPKLEVTGPGGLVPKIEHVVDKDKIEIVKLTGTKPGDYIAKVGSKTNTTVVISAKTSITFRHGFSTFKPSSINDTATRPIPGEKSFLSIKLNGDIQLKTVKIMDMDKNLITEIPLEIVDSDQKIYVTKPITFPDKIFRIAITGYDPETKSTITRLSMTPIEPQNPAVGLRNEAPTVTIEQAPKINAEYDEPLTLKCKVSAYPKPDIIWEDKETGTGLPASVYSIELPYKYMSSLDLGKVKKNGTYQCKASNLLGVNIQQIDVETKRKTYFTILESPKGTCGSSELDPDFKVFRQLADATSGQIFNLMKNDVKDILDYVVETIKGRMTELASGKFAPGYNNSLPFTLDIRSSDLLISVTGTDPKLEVTGPGGLVPKIEHVVDKDKIEIVKLTGTKPGDYIAKVGSKTNTTVVISAKTSITFRHGFSTFKPSSINDTATRPIPGEKSFLSIKLNGDIQLKTVKIMDMDKNLITEIPLEIVDSDQKIYVTKPITFPDKIFRIAITGYDPETKSTITRLSMTPIEPQNPAVGLRNEAPTVTIEQAPKINAEYDEPLTLKCKVSAYPKPDIIWEDKETGTGLPASVYSIELPYKYMSSLDLGKVKKNGTYQCKASNLLGVNIQQIDVETKRKTYFTILESPKDTVIEYNTEGQLFCKIDSFPLAKINWRKIDAKPLNEDKRYSISPDGSTMTIRSMMPNMTGIFTCEAYNEYNKQNFAFSIAISGVDRPIINKTISEVRVRNGVDVSINCSLLQGKPKPEIRWFFKSFRSDTYSEYKAFMDHQILYLGQTNGRSSGTYLCVANNVMGNDTHETVLIIEYPPIVKSNNKRKVLVKAGDKIALNCSVDGVPTPTVTWLKDGAAVLNKSLISNSHTLSIRVSLEDTGIYTCEATNLHGTGRINVQVDVFVPVNIEIPLSTTHKMKINGNKTLPCHATGYPEPDIKWIFYSSDSSVPPQPLKSTGSSLRLTRLQLKNQGFYTCIASNIGDSKNMTHEVMLYVPPIIENLYPEKKFTAVEGDKALRIICNAYGSPKPTITWKVDGFNIAADSPWYDIDNGTLIIKEIDEYAQAQYICEARNSYGVDFETYEVHVEKYPKVVRPINSLLLEEGKMAAVECNIPHTRIDSLRWYKDGVLITNGELFLDSVTSANSGIYTCRVSNFFRSRSRSTEIKVGHKPRFISEEEDNIDYLEGNLAFFSCEAEADPIPEVSWWHNSNKLNVSSMSYEFTMNINDQAQSYMCNVSNHFGFITRQFHITSRDCILDFGKGLTGNQPLLVTNSLRFLPFENINGTIFVPRNNYFILSCLKKFTKIPKPNIVAFCEGGDNLKVDGNIYKYFELTCTEELKPILRQTGKKCLRGNTETVKVMYEILDNTVEVYEICLDKDRNVPLYAKHVLQRNLANMALKETEWLKTDLLPVDFEKLYDCSHQSHQISIMLGKWFHKSDGCCFSKRQLVSPRDVFPGVPQKATYTYLNVIPQWGSCNTDNWDDVEQRVRNLAKSTYGHLNIWTGTSGQLMLTNTLSQNVDLFIKDNDHGQQPVSQYLWKVVQDPASRASLAIIQINTPDLLQSEVYKFIKCRDICKYISWMKNINWHDTKKGFIYCCSLEDFKRAFDYDALFERGMENILYDVSIIPKYTLI